MSIGSMSVKISADISQFNKNIASVQKQLNTSTKGLQTIGRNLTTVGDSMVKGITLPILAVGAGLLKLGEDFDAAYDKIRVGTGKTGKELEALNDDFRAVAKVAPSSFNDISIAVSGYNKTLGLAGEANQKLSTQVLNLSRLTKTDLNANVTESSKVFNNWKISTENQGAALDLIFRAGQKAKISVTDLMAEVSNSGPILRTMGYDFETSTALIAGFQKAGVDVTSTIAGMKKALVTMAKEGMGDPQEVLSMYIEKIKGAKTEVEAIGIAAELFGARGGAQMAIAIREGRLNLDDLVTSLKTGTDTINDAAKATDDWKEKLILLKNNLGIALEPLATKVFDSLGRVIDGVTPKIEELATEFGNLSPAMQDNLIKYGLIVAVLPLVVSGLGRAMTGVIQLRNALLLLNAAVNSSLLIKGIGLTSTSLASAVVLIGAVANRLGGLTKAWATGELAAMSWNDKILEILNVSLLGIPEILNAISRVAGLPAKEFKYGFDAMIKSIFEGKPVIEAATLSTEDQTKAFNDALGAVTAYQTAQHQGREATVEAKVAAVDHENALQGLMTQYGITREEAVKYYNKTQEGTGDIEDQTDAVNKLRDEFNKLIDDIFGGITTYNDFQEANWAVEAAQKALTEAIKKFGEGSQEAMQAQNDLDDAMIANIETAFKLSNQIGATTEEQEEARKKAIELGLQYVESGAISAQAFMEMAAKFGLSSDDIIKYADNTDIKLTWLTRERMISVETGRSISAVNLLEEALNRIHDVDKTVTITGVMAGQDLTHFMSGGGIVGFSQGGFLDKILSASKGINLPKFDNGGVLAMLHPPEVVLNGKQALQILWNQAQQPVKSEQSTNTKNEITLHNVMKLDEKVLYDSWEKIDLREQARRV